MRRSPCCTSVIRCFDRRRLVASPTHPPFRVPQAQRASWVVCAVLRALPRQTQSPIWLYACSPEVLWTQCRHHVAWPVQGAGDAHASEVRSVGPETMSIVFAHPVSLSRQTRRDDRDTHENASRMHTETGIPRIRSGYTGASNNVNDAHISHVTSRYDVCCI